MKNIKTYSYQRAELHEITDFRNKYFNSLYESQELFLELMVEDAEKYLIQIDSENIGYFIKTTDGYLVEFYIEDAFLTDCVDIFKNVVINNQILTAYCKSFDAVLLKACLHTHKSLEIIGVLYRDFTNKEIAKPGEIDRIKIAELSDYELIKELKDEVFETEEEIGTYIRKKAIMLFKNKEVVIGYGIFNPSSEGSTSYDIGMAVAPDFRKKGYGAYILNYMKNHCLKNNWRPTCGCAIENIASQKTIEKIGFVSKHNMLEFSF